MIKQRWNYKP